MTHKIRRTEHWYFITTDGVQYLLEVGDKRIVQSVDGTGMPPIDYITQRGVYQHGETLVDMFLKPRTIQMMIRHRYNCRNDYWNGRAQLLDILRPNRGIPCAQGILRKELADGSKRDFNAIIMEGPAFVAEDNTVWARRTYVEELRFICNDPVAFDPVAKIVNIVFTNVQVVFPTTFSITFGATSALTSVITNGNWETYPTIDLYGAIQVPTIENITTDERIGLSYNLAAGEVIRIVTNYGTKSIVKAPSTDMVGYVTKDSDLATFHLAPGTNVLKLTGGTPDANAKAVVTYYDKYIGI